MEDSASRRNAHKKKKKRSRHSSAESSDNSSASSDGEMTRKKSRTSEHKRKDDHRGDKHKREHDKHRHDRDKKRGSSPAQEEVRHGRDDRNKHHRDRGERWEDEEKRYDQSGHRIKQEPPSDDNNAPRGRGQHDRGGRRGGRGSFGRGRGRGGGGGGGDEQFQWGKQNQDQGDKKPKVEKEKPNFGLSGKLTEEVNTVNGVVVKYAEPPEARKPKRRWRLYVFKGEETMPTLYIHRQSAYLMGRDRKVADIPLDHPSVSKQHAALQYRLVTFKREDGMSTGKCIRPYIIDLESANGTFVNNKKIEPKKYVQIMEKDVLKFGYSSREYVLLHEHSQDTNSGDDDDVNEGPNP